jgi:hypothetical protein
MRPVKTANAAQFCKLCGLNEATCRAHIIPRKFYDRIKRQGTPLIDFDIGANIKRKTTQSGIWETGVLCPQCDGRIGDSDNYAYRVLPAVPLKERFKIFPMDLRAYEVGMLNLDRFRSFLASLAWRSAHAEHPFFGNVSLGPYETRLKEILLGTATSDILQAVNALIILLKPPTYDFILWPPCRTRIDGVNVLQFYLYPWKLIIKLDRRDFGHPFNDFVLRHGRPAYAYVQDFWTPSEKQALQKLRIRIQELAKNSSA